ncbi:hypothetical protein [Risungbinella massiliensis]|uniref:hypothetical protein n=1 Tax=Risungbinella massiliensis TaxID=1329796 RepID=UPI0005CB7FA8|nr:hypothetical protein [Risungbinella massiliensis]
MKKSLRFGVYAFIFTITLLFSGFMLYQTYAVAQPIKEQATNISGIQVISQRVTPDKVEMTVTFAKGFDFAEKYPIFIQEVEQKAGNRELDIQIQDRPNAKLKQVWNESELAIQEGLALKRYTLIEEKIAMKASSFELTQSKVRIDDQYLYISLQDHDHTLYRVLPLDQSEKGVQE